MNLILVTVVAVLCWLPGNSSQKIDPEIKKKIDDFINDVYLPRAELSSLALTIVQDDGNVLYTTGFGFADQEKGIQNDNETQFLIGSITKSFTSVAVVKAFVEHFPKLGEAALDTPLVKLLPQANLTFIDRFRAEHMTFRDLLAHRACLFRHDLPLLAEPFETTEEHAYRSRYSEEICGIRSEFQYNNGMYTVAGELLGALLNKTYYEVIQDLLAELGMSNSAIALNTDDFENLPRRSKPYYVMDNVSHPINTELLRRVTAYNPAGGLYATPNDFARYMRFYLNVGKLDGKQIIPEAAMRWLTKSAIVLPSAQPYHSDCYGLGIIVTKYEGVPFLQHGGHFPPYSSLLSMFPEQKIGIFTSTNQSPAKIDAVNLHLFIFETLKGNKRAFKKVDVLMQKKAKNETEMSVLISQKVMMENPMKNDVNAEPTTIVGKYGNGAAGDLEILEKWNNATNSSGVYLLYGKWLGGWVENFQGNFYKVLVDTDMVQDIYAAGQKEGVLYIQIQNETVDFITEVAPGTLGSMGSFRIGVSLDTLPVIPWAPGSCGV